MSYVVIMPRSNSNPSDDYLVVDYDAWIRAMDNGWPLRPHSRHDVYEPAVYEADRLNGKVL